MAATSAIILPGNVVQVDFDHSGVDPSEIHLYPLNLPSFTQNTFMTDVKHVHQHHIVLGKSFNRKDVSY